MFLLAGEVGTGKTTAIQAAVRGLPAKTPVAFPPPTTSTPSELLDEVCLAVGLANRARESKAERQRRLEGILARLAAEGRKPDVIVDEAHLVTDAVFEQLRLLTNLRGGLHPVLQICLVGQPELVGRLRSDHLRQLRQRITLRYTLMPLTYDETRLYLIERLRAAGARCPHGFFTPEAVQAIFAMTAGIPREINVVADQAMTNAFLQNASIVHERHVRTVGSDFGFEGLFLHRLQGTDPLPPEPQCKSPAAEETVPTTALPSSVEALPDAPPVQTSVPVPATVVSTEAQTDPAPESMASPEETWRPVDTLDHRTRALVAAADVLRLIRYRP
jgi:general secretion pathway protein A